MQPWSQKLRPGISPSTQESIYGEAFPVARNNTHTGNEVRVIAFGRLWNSWNGHRFFTSEKEEVTPLWFMYSFLFFNLSPPLSRSPAVDVLRDSRHYIGLFSASCVQEPGGMGWKRSSSHKIDSLLGSRVSPLRRSRCPQILCQLPKHF